MCKISTALMVSVIVAMSVFAGPALCMAQINALYSNHAGRLETA